MNSSRRGPRRILGRFELPLKRFCDVAFLSYIDLLNKEKKDVLRAFKDGDSEKCYKAVAKAKTSCENIKSAIFEIESLKEDMHDPRDVEEFIRRVSPKKQKLEEEIMELAKLMRNVLVVESNVSDIEDGQNSSDYYGDDTGKTTKMFDDRRKLHDLEASTERRLEQLETYQKLEKDTEDISSVMREISRLVHEQANVIDSIEDNISVADVNVQQGVKHVEAAAKMQVAAFPLAGALLGSCIGGPVGLLVGAKVGGMVALGGAVIGYASGKLVKYTQSHGLSSMEIASIPINTHEEEYKRIPESDNRVTFRNTHNGVK